MFEQPEVLLLLLAIPLFVAFFAWRDRARWMAVQRLGDAPLIAALTASIMPERRRWKSVLWLGAYASLVIGLARPVWGVDADIVEATGVAIVVALDVSSSMDAEDVLPSRLERAKLTIRSLLESNAAGQFGLVLFAGDAFVQFPLTSDVDSAAAFVSAASSRSISRQGTAVEDAILLGLSVFDRRIVSDPIMILMSDGENHTGNPLAAAQLAAEQGVTIHVIGYGSEEGELIPVRDEEGNLIEYKYDRGRNLIITRLDEPVLQGIAEATGGLYQRASENSIEVVNLLNRIAETQGSVLERRLQTRAVQRFGIFVALAVFLLSVEMLLPEARRVARPPENELLPLEMPEGTQS